MIKKGLFLCFLVIVFIQAEMKQACKVVYQGDLNQLKDSTVEINCSVTREVKPGETDLQRGIIKPLAMIVQPGLSAQQLWNKLFTETLPNGVTINNLSYTGASNASGSYTGMPDLQQIKIKDGIILTSGEAKLAEGPNSSDLEGTDNGASGYVPIEQIGGDSHNASLLTIGFTTNTSINGVTFDFVYGSEEYEEFVGSMFNDVFAAFLDGKNISFDNDGKPITVNNDFFKIDNTDDILDLQYDGFTPLLRTSSPLKAGKHTLVFAIADIGDELWDSGVFLSNFKFALGDTGTHPVKIIPDIDSSVIYDANGNGIGDSLVIFFSDTINKLSISKIDLQWPAGSTPLKNVDITSATLLNNRILSATKTAITEEYTYGTGQVTVFIDSFGTATQRKASVLDGIAPVIHSLTKSALLRDYKLASKHDTLGVRFSEPVKILTPDEPFYFYSNASKINYAVTLSDPGQPKPDSMVFQVAVVTGVASMLDGDSLWIHETNRVVDNRGNFQNNTKNSKRKLYVEQLFGPITIECGYYYDSNADGYVDSVYVKATTDLVGGLTDAHLQAIVSNALTLPAFRGFTINSRGLTSGGFFIKVTEDKAHTPFTYITSDDRLIIKQYTISTGGEVIGGNYPIYDRIAPIIHWDARSALLRDNKVASKPDTLGIKFSEPVKEAASTSNEPFYFLSHTNNTSYVVKLSKAGTGISHHPKPDSLVFQVVSVTGVAAMQDGDSLWIHETNLIADDTAGNYQNNNKNTRRKLYVEQVYGPVTIGGVYYYDNTADGYVDSIYVKATTDIEGGLTNTHVQEMVSKAITLPVFRGFTVSSYGITAGGFFIKVTENTTHTPVTYVTADDKLVVSQIVLTTGGEVMAGTYPIYDRIAPLIHWDARSALLRDYKVASKNDTLGVKFSEPVKNVATTIDEPFYFLRRTNNTNYVVKLSAPSQPKPDSLVFQVVSVTGVSSMQDGDSVWIHETNRIADTAGNFQNNTKNTKRKLYVEQIYSPITIECGYYYDINADGYVDSIYVKATTDIEGGLTNAHVQEIVIKAITLPSFRGFTINSYGLSQGGFFIIVGEPSSHTPFTFITNNDKLVVSSYTLSMGGEVAGGTYPIYDRIAPLIHWEPKSAYLIDYMADTTKDTIFITFSEPVKKITNTEPFYFLSKENNANYTVTLNDFPQPEATKMVFVVTSVSGVSYMKDGDSVWIHEIDRVCDAEGNYQNSSHNTKRRLYVKRIAVPYTFVPKAVSPISLQDMASVNRVPAEIIAVLNSNGILNSLNLQKNQTGEYGGMMIMVVPNPQNIGQFIPDLKVNGTLTILDAVGNTVASKVKMGWWDERKSLVWVWNCKNQNGRLVGPGMYVCIFELEDVTESVGNKNKPQKEVKRIVLGVK